MYMFNEEHEEQYWQQRYAARMDDNDKQTILYIEPSRPDRTPLECIAGEGKIAEMELGLL